MHRNKWVVGMVLLFIAGSIWLLYKYRINLGLDLKGGTHLVLELDTSKLPPDKNVREAVEHAREIIENRVNALGVTEPIVQRQGEKWIVVQLPGLKDPERARNVIGKTALLEFKLVAIEDEDPKKKEEALKGNIPQNLEVLYDREGRPYLLEKERLLDGSYLKSARMAVGGRYGFEPVVEFEFNPEGARKFGEITGKNIGRRLAIILDNVVYSAPVIRDRITSRGEISGGFTDKEASDLALVLRSGSLPAPLRIIQNVTVGPSLGEDSIRKGVTASIVATILVVLFMGIYYKISGLIADLALLGNLIMLLGALAGLHATLTLPGIAGIALTMGMAVDANVLIFERIKEEMRKGKTIRASVDAGYKRALLTIIDSHVTTLITALILFTFGTGPIRGFAVSLSLGVAISLFTALIITKIVFDYRLSRGEVTSLSI
jgi:preprotein translocase subunit SecD